MSHQRRHVGMLAAGAMTVALLASPAATLAQDGATMTAVSEACRAENLGDALKNPGRLTVSTDNPAFSPWFVGPVPAGSDWADYGQYPPAGGGFEGEYAYAIARELGFQPDQVDWIGQSAFGLAFAPGEKGFDFHLGQVSYDDERATAVDFSDSYYEATQSIVALAGDPINEVTTLEAIKDVQLGAPVGTTSLIILEEVIAPNVEPKVYDSVADATQALANGQIQGLVVDTPTGFYIRDGILPFEPFEMEGSLVGQIPVESQEVFGAVLEKDSPLTGCVTEAITVIRTGGRHEQLLAVWIDSAGEAPVLQ